MKTFSHTFKKVKGFTLVETLIAISILALAITGPMVIAQKGIGSAIYSRDEVTATYLAQEAVEYVRNVRDTNRIGGYSGGWLAQFQSAGCIDTGSNGARCEINALEDYTNSSHLSYAISECSAGHVNGTDVCAPLGFDQTQNLYGYQNSDSQFAGNTWIATPFTRTVDIKMINSTEAVVTVTISWETNIFSPAQSFTAAEHIFAF